MIDKNKTIVFEHYIEFKNKFATKLNNFQFKKFMIYVQKQADNRSNNVGFKNINIKLNE